MKPIKQQVTLAMLRDQEEDWIEAHRIVQALNHPLAYQIHGYLHRKEGDISNAHYWYQRANISDRDGDFEIERLNIMNQIQDL
jgi:hypothetical protein